MDVHISVDGADSDANRYRKTRSGKPNFDRVRRGLENLKEEGCKIQFDSCLTDANHNKIIELVDFGSSYNVHSIYLAPIDVQDGRMTSIDMESESTIRTIYRARSYAAFKKIALGGPWELALSDRKLHNKDSKTLPYLIFNVDGDAHISPFPKLPIGNAFSDSIETIKNSNALKVQNEKFKKLTESCEKCDIYSTCNRYLKSMAMYHTGDVDNSRKECKLAQSISTLIVKSDDEELELTRHISISREGESVKIKNTMHGSILKASIDMLHFISLFKAPNSISNILKEYEVEGIHSTVEMLKKNRVLLDSNWVENEAHLYQTLGKSLNETIDGKARILHRGGGDFKYLCSAVNIAYTRMLDRGLPEFIGPITVFLCSEREDMQRLWGKKIIPNNVKGFVIGRRIYVAEKDRHSEEFCKSETFLESMMHEIMHMYIGMLRINLPVWMEEGLCEFYSKTLNETQRSEILNQRPVYSFTDIEFLCAHTLLDLDSSRVRENLCYAQSHSFVSYIFENYLENSWFDLLNQCPLTMSVKDFLLYNDLDLKVLEKKWLKDHQYEQALLKVSKNLRIIAGEKKDLVYNSFYGGGVKVGKGVSYVIQELKKGKSIADLDSEYDLSDMKRIFSTLLDKKLLTYENEINVPYINSNTEKN